MLARREYKFLIDERTADRVRALIAGYCERDVHAVATGGRYLCDTLYFDTIGWSLYHATVDNAPTRHKLRVRSYPLAPDAPVFLEVKRRVGDAIRKTRAKLPRATWAHILDETALDDVPTSEHAALENFLARHRSANHGMIVPAVLVRYEREPYTSLVDDYARVTFDRQICFQAQPELSVDPPTDHWISIDDAASAWPAGGSPIVLELKFTAPPIWMRRVIELLELRRLAFCKYARAVDTMLNPPARRVSTHR